MKIERDIKSTFGVSLNSTCEAAKLVLERAPKIVIGVCLVSVFAQLAKIVAFLLPIKAILVAGADVLPHYYSIISEEITREGVIAFLALGSILFYMSHLYLERVRERLADLYFSESWASDGVVDKQDFNPVDYRIINALLELLTSVIFVLLISPLWVVYTNFTFFVLIGVGTFLMLALLRGIRERIRHWFEIDAASCVGVLSSLFFLYGFVVILKNVASGETGVLMGILNLLLFRIFLTQIQVFVSRSESFRLRSDRFYSMMNELNSPAALLPDIGPSLSGVAQGFFNALTARYELGTSRKALEKSLGMTRLFSGDRFYFKYQPESWLGNNAHYLAVWKSNKSADCLTEIEFLEASQGAHEIVPNIVENELLDSNRYLLYNLGSYADCQPDDFVEAKSVFFEELWAIDPALNVELPSCWGTRPLSERLDFERVSALLDWSRNRELTDEVGFQELVWEDVLRWLDSLPTQWTVSATEETLLFDRNKMSACCMCWHGVREEPIGYLLNGAAHRIDISEVLSKSQLKRSSLLNVSAVDIELVSMLSQVEFFIDRSRFVRATELLNRFFDTWAKRSET